MTPVWVFGAGGHAAVVIDTVRAMENFEVAGVLDDDPGRLGAEVLGVRVSGSISRNSLLRLGVKHAIIAVGSNRTRAAIAEKFNGHVSWVTAVHPKACLAESVRIGVGTVVFAGVVVQPGAFVGDHAILNTACSVDHNNRIGNYAHLAPGVRLAGDVEIGSGAMLGIGSSVLPGRCVGSWATIGAGSVVVHDIPLGVTAKGVPARFPMPSGSWHS